MRIGIGAGLVAGQKVGVAVYADELIRNLAKLDGQNEYIIFPFNSYSFLENFDDYRVPGRRNFERVWSGRSKEIVKRLWFGNKTLRKILLPKLDLYHATSFTYPIEGLAKKVIFTVHDVSFYTHPQFHLKQNIDHCDANVRKAVKEAALILADSDNTKLDLIKYYDCPAEKIRRIYLACDEKMYRKSDDKFLKRVLNRYGLTEKSYIFHLGSLEPRKNTLGLIKAYSWLPSSVRKKYKLVIGGASGWMNSNIGDYIKCHGLENEVEMIGYVAEKDKASLYRGARLFAYPSFYEGFGLPVLEAMACGCPVLTANNSSLLEVGGSAVEYCNAYDIEEIRERLKNLLRNNDKLVLMKKAGKKQAKVFSWEKTASETLECYRKLL